MQQDKNQNVRGKKMPVLGLTKSEEAIFKSCFSS